MSRTSRLFELMQLLRCHRHAVKAHVLAVHLGVSVRTVYRDIETLRQQGADIRGEAGVGFVLKQDFLLPPLMLDAKEMEALVFATRWLVQQPDSGLAEQAKSALAKIQTVLPNSLNRETNQYSLYPISHPPFSTMEAPVLALVRQALRDERKLQLEYEDADGSLSQRTVWPLALAYFEHARILAAWCELRQAFRHFRTDRMMAVKLGEAMPMPRPAMLVRWQKQQCFSLPD